MKPFLFSILFIGLAITVSSQECKCGENLVTLDKSLQENYPGYALKTGRPDFTRHFDSLKSVASLAKTDLTCYRLLKGLISFFRDPHLSLNISSGKTNISRIRAMFSEIENIEYQAPATHLPALKSDPICGKWEIKGQGTYYKIDIQPAANGKLFIGSIISSDTIFWMPGQVKCILYSLGKRLYAAEVYTKDHSPSRFNLLLSNNNVMDWGSLGVYQRTDPNLDPTVLDSLIKLKKNIYISQPAPGIVYLRIPSFEIANYTLLKKILQEKMPEKMDDKTLILDLRGNSGGSTLVSNLLLKYVYQDPIVMDGSRFYTSAQNVIDYEKGVSQLTFSPSDKQRLDEQLKRLKATPNALVEFAEKETITLDSGLVNTKQVYILTNVFCGSTTELFILQAMQSPKVKTVGQKTRGATDYTNLSYPRSIPCTIFYYLTPMTVSDSVSSAKLENNGIAPAIPLPEDIDALDYIIAKSK